MGSDDQFPRTDSEYEVRVPTGSLPHPAQPGRLTHVLEGSTVPVCQVHPEELPDNARLAVAHGHPKEFGEARVRTQEAQASCEKCSS